MNKKMYEQLQKDLAVAIKEKNISKINMIRNILEATKTYDLIPGQEKYFEKGMTGYASIDMPWLKLYKENAFAYANSGPTDKTVWDVIEEKLKDYYDVPAIEYFGRKIYSEEFINDVYKWASTLKAMGIEQDEVVPVYGPFFPEVCAMTFAFNMIGATPYFLKLAITPEALAEETKDSKVAVVFDEMWKNVASEFTKDRFKKVIITSPTTGMPSPKKEIVSFISAIKSRKDKNGIPDNPKYITTDQALSIADYYTGDVKAEFKPNRSAFITSSSGTTVGGVVKGTVATNETTVSQLYMGKASETQYHPGDRCLTHFPPTASTSLNILFFYPLYNKMTSIVDPRVSEDAFYDQLTKLKPNVVVSTGSLWEAFFNRVENEMQNGKKFDFSYAKAWTIGGEGSDVKKFDKWNELMKKANSPYDVISGYGSSELFSAVSVEKQGERYKSSNGLMSVGIPYAGLTMGVFDENGRELPYNTRGELRIKSNSAMKEYYNKPELTDKTKVDGWILTGDAAQLDENGYIYIEGRLKDKIVINNTDLYMFDVARKIKEVKGIDDAIVLPMPTEENVNNLVAHIVFDKDIDPSVKKDIIGEINNKLKNYLPQGIELSAYAEHEIMLPYSPTTLKKDKNKMIKQTSGYIQVINGETYNVEFIINSDGKYNKKCDILVNSRVRKLSK